MPVDPSVAASRTKRRRRRRSVTARHRAARKKSSSDGSIKKSVSFLDSYVQSDTDISRQTSQSSKSSVEIVAALQEPSGDKATRSILKRSREPAGEIRKTTVAKEAEPLAITAARSRHSPSPPPGPPPLMPVRKRRGADTDTAPTDKKLVDNVEDDDTNSVKQVISSSVGDPFGVGLCGTDLVVCDNTENLHERIEHRMATSCATGAEEEGKGARLLHLASSQQEFSLASIDASTCGRKIPVSWYGWLNTMKERFRSDAVEEVCCNAADSAPAACDVSSIDQSSISSKFQDLEPYTSRAKESLQATMVTMESMRAKAGETLDPVVVRLKSESAKSYTQSEAWCRQNVANVLATDCQQEMVLCKVETCPGTYSEDQAAEVPKGSDTPEETESSLLEKEEAHLRREQAFGSRFKRAGTVLRQHFTSMLPPLGLAQENVVLLDLPPNFGHDSKNLKDPVEETPKDNTSPPKFTKVIMYRTPELGNDDDNKTPEEAPQVNAAPKIQQENKKPTDVSDAPQEPDGVNAVADDATLERNPRKKAPGSVASSAETQEKLARLIDSVTDVDDASTLITQGTMTNPIVLVDDEGSVTRKDKQQHVATLLSLEDQSHVSGLTCGAKSQMSSLNSSMHGSNGEIKEHLKGLVEEYLSKQMKQNKGTGGAVTVNSNKAAEELLSTLKSQMTGCSQGNPKAPRSSGEARQSLPVAEESQESPILPPKAGEQRVDRFKSKLQKAKLLKATNAILPPKPKKLLADPCKNGRIAGGTCVELKKPTVSKPNLMADPFKYGIMDAHWQPATKPKSEHRDDQQGSVKSRGSFGGDSRQEDAHPWLFQDPRYEHRTQEVHLQSQPSPISAVFRQYSRDSSKSVSSSKSSIMAGQSMPKRTKSVSFNLPPSDGEGEEARRIITNKSQNSSSCSYRSKREAILARREELARLSQRQAFLFERGQRIIQNRLQQSGTLSSS